jgi:hypothetical protein
MMRTSAGKRIPKPKRSRHPVVSRSSSLGIKAEPTYPAPPRYENPQSLLKVLIRLALGYFIRNDGRKLACGSAPLALSAGQPKWTGTPVALWLWRGSVQRSNTGLRAGIRYLAHPLSRTVTIFRLENAGVHACGIFARNQLIEQLFILVHDPVPVVERAYRSGARRQSSATSGRSSIN